MNAPTGYAAVIEALEHVGSRRYGKDWQCPAHDDGKPSLSVNAGDDGRALVHCQANCATSDVLRALGLEMSDLFADEPRSEDAREVAHYDYTDEDGTVLFQVVRLANKKFYQRRPDGNGGWTPGVKGVRRVLFHLPALIEGVIAGETIYVVEGEKDVLAMERAGVTATCNPMGAGKWSDDYAPYFDGADVIVVADKDVSGRDHAEAVRRSVLTRAKSVRVVEVADPHHDAAEHLAAGLGLDVLTTPTTPVARTSILKRGSETMAEKLEWMWPGYAPMLPIMLDGEPGLGKSSLTVDIGARLTAQHALPDGYIAPEPGLFIVLSSEDAFENTIKPRFVAADGDVERVFHHDPAQDFSLPDDIDALAAELAALREEYGPTAPMLVVIDPLTAYVSDSVNIWKDSDVRRIFRRLTPLCKTYSCAIIGLRHLKKDKDGSALNAGGGSIAFIAAVRTGWMIGIHPEDRDLDWDREHQNDPRRRVLALSKMNVAKYAPSRVLTIEPCMPFSLDDVLFTGKDIAVIRWQGTDGVSADRLVREALSEGSRAPAPLRGDAIATLRTILEHGPQLATVVEDEVIRESGCARSTVTRARAEMGVVKAKEPTMGGRWWWALPEHEVELHDKAARSGA